jgi:hypothetical protein
MQHVEREGKESNSKKKQTGGVPEATVLLIRSSRWATCNTKVPGDSFLKAMRTSTGHAFVDTVPLKLLLASLCISLPVFSFPPTTMLAATTCSA